MNEFHVGDWVEFDVPEVEGIGPGYTGRGRVDEIYEGTLILRGCTDGEEHWRSPDEVRAVTSRTQEGSDGR